MGRLGSTPCALGPAGSRLRSSSLGLPSGTGRPPPSCRSISTCPAVGKLDNFSFLLVDDLGYLPQPRSPRPLHPIAERYERRSWASIKPGFARARAITNPMATAAAIDRRQLRHPGVCRPQLPDQRCPERVQAKEVKQNFLRRTGKYVDAGNDLLFKAIAGWVPSGAAHDVHGRPGRKIICRMPFYITFTRFC